MREGRKRKIQPVSPEVNGYNSQGERERERKEGEKRGYKNPII